MSELPSEYSILIDELSIVKTIYSEAVAMAHKEHRNPEVCIEIHILHTILEEYIFNNSRNY
jgi:nitroimidazol reductase NimA-like FMN-containing flavoprotein (pyridoxamine 5'-phosphate oxidase superfamily)